MMHQACVGVILILASNCILVLASPGFSFRNIRFGKQKTFDYDYENVMSKHYNIYTTVSGKKSKCVKRVTATGNGVGEVFNRPCSPNGVFTTTSNKFMIYGNPEKDTFSFFSDQDSNLIVNQDGKCTRRKYKTVTSKTVAEISEMSVVECKQAREKVKTLIDQQSKYLEVLDNKGKEKRPDSTKSAVTSSLKSLSQTVETGNINKNNPTDSKQGSKSTQNDLSPVGAGNTQSSQSAVQVSEPLYTSGNKYPLSGTKLASGIFDSASLGSRYSKLKPQVSSYGWGY